MNVIQIIKEEIQIQLERYYRTRYGKVFAIFMLISLYHFVPFVLQTIVPMLAEYVSESTAYVIIMPSTGVFKCFMRTLFTNYRNVKYHRIVYIISVLQNSHRDRKTPYYTMEFCISYTLRKYLFLNSIESMQRQNFHYAQKPWPWQQNPQKWYNDLVWRSIKATCFDIFIVIPSLLFLSFQVQFQYIMDMNKPTPLKDFAVQIIIMLFLEDLIYFMTHKALHSPAFYKYHKKHHQYVTTVSIAGLHSSLAEFLILNSIVAAIYMRLAALYAPLHVSTAVIWIITRMLDAYNSHSGYMFSWTPLQLLPFCTNDEYHDFHHSHNCGNFSSQLRYLDILFGSNKDFREYKLQRIKSKKN